MVRARRCTPTRRLWVVFAAMLVALGTLAVPPAAAEETDDHSDSDATAVTGAADPDKITSFPGEIGTIVENLLDDLIPSRRYRGANRFDTAGLIANDAYDNPDEVIIARNDIFPDALAGSFYSGHHDAPLLLVDRFEGGHGTQISFDALEELGADKVTLLGETFAIPRAVEQEFRDAGYNVNRIGGADRFETAAMLAQASGTSVGEREGKGRTAIVARASDFADALVAGTLSHTAGFPLLLTSSSSLHPASKEALDNLNIDHVIIPGGTNAVSQGVEDEIEADGIDVKRIFGPDRVATSVKFADFMREELGFGLERVNFAIGSRFPDALALAGLSGPRGQPIILTANQNELGGGGTVKEFLEQTCSIDMAGIAGGHRAVSESLEQEIRTLATDLEVPCRVSLVPSLHLGELGDEHTQTTIVENNAGTRIADEPVRIQVYRVTDLQLPLDLDLVSDLTGLLDDATNDLTGMLPLEDLLGVLEGVLDDVGGDLTLTGPVERGQGVTDSNGEWPFDYTGPDLPALDISIACLDEDPEDPEARCSLVNISDLDLGNLDLENLDLSPGPLSSTAVTLWAADLTGLLPNLLLLDPLLEVGPSGTDHDLVATVLSADLDALGLLGSAGTAQTSALPDLGGVTTTDPSILEDLLGLGLVGDPDELGERVPNEDVRFEVYRATDVLPDNLLESILALDVADPTSALEDLLRGVDIAALVDALGASPVVEEVVPSNAEGEALFDYEGVDDLLPGLDLILACIDRNVEGDDCVPVVSGALDLPSPHPDLGVGAALWLPALLDLDPLAALGQSGEDATHTVDLSALLPTGDPAADLPVSYEAWRTDDLAELVGLLEELLAEADLELTDVIDGLDLTDLGTVTMDDVEQALLDAVLEALEAELTDEELAEVLDSDTLEALGLERVDSGTAVTDEDGNSDWTYDGPTENSAADLVVGCVGGNGCNLTDDLTDLDVDLHRMPALASMLWLDVDLLDEALDEDLADLLGDRILDLVEAGTLDAEDLDPGLVEELAIEEQLELLDPGISL